MASGAEDLLELEGGGLLELVVAAIGRLLVGTPALERGPVAEPIALEVVARHLGDPLEAERLPRQVLAPVPARRRAGEPLTGFLGRLRPLCPLAPWVTLERVLPQRRELLGERRALVPGERRRHADAVQRARIVEEPKQQRADVRARPVLVPPEAR